MDKYIPLRNHRVEYVVFNPATTDFHAHSFPEQNPSDQPNTDRGGGSKFLWTIAVIFGALVIIYYVQSNNELRKNNKNNE